MKFITLIISILTIVLSAYFTFYGLWNKDIYPMIAAICFTCLGCFCFMFGRWVREVFEKEEE